MIFLEICSGSKETTSKQQRVFVGVSDTVAGLLVCCGVGIAKCLQSFITTAGLSKRQSLSTAGPTQDFFHPDDHTQPNFMGSNLSRSCFSYNIHF